MGMFDEVVVGVGLLFGVVAVAFAVAAAMSASGRLSRLLTALPLRH